MHSFKSFSTKEYDIYLVHHFITARKRSLGQCNIFIGVCQEYSVHGGGGGGVPGQVPPRADTPPADTPPGRHALPWQVHTPGRHPLAGTPPWD